MAKKCKCKWPGNIVSVKPDGVNELDPCVYETKEIHRNVTVEINQCKVCGNIEIVWHRQDDTEDEIIEELEEEPDEN